MKNLTTLFSLVCLISSNTIILAQETADASLSIPYNYKDRSPIYDYSEPQLNNVDTIPDFATKPKKLKISGTIFQPDGITPASDVILYIYQPDETGNYEMKRDNFRKRYVYHRGWIKTNADGHYTFYTFMPGKYLHTKELKKIHRMIKQPGKPEYELNAFFFNDDPLIPDLTLACRAKAVQSMLRLEHQKDGMYVATKDIVLTENSPEEQ